MPLVLALVLPSALVTWLKLKSSLEAYAKGFDGELELESESLLGSWKKVSLLSWDLGKQN